MCCAMQYPTCGLLLGPQLSVELLNVVLQISELRSVLLVILLRLLHRMRSCFVTGQGKPPSLYAVHTRDDAAAILLADARLMSPDAPWG